jgi:hypothetical protein
VSKHFVSKPPLTHNIYMKEYRDVLHRAMVGIDFILTNHIEVVFTFASIKLVFIVFQICSTTACRH